MDPRSITLAASELFEQGHYPSVVAVCNDALADAIEHLELRILMARALIALRQDTEAKRQLGVILQQDPNSSIAFQLLGEIAFRADDLHSAEIYFRESTRLNDHNEGARIWLDLVLSMNRPGESDEHILVLQPKQPVPASGHWDSGQLVLPRKKRRRRFAKGTDRHLKAARVIDEESGNAESVGRVSARARARARFAEGSHNRSLNGSFNRSLNGSLNRSLNGSLNRSLNNSLNRSRNESFDVPGLPSVRTSSGAIDTANPDRPSFRSGSIDTSRVNSRRARSRAGDSTRVGRLRSGASANNLRAASRPNSRRPSSARLSTQMPVVRPPPIPGQPADGHIGGYLVDMGLLTAEQLAHALKHQTVSKMRVGEAAVVLGFISQQKLDWAALGFHCRRD